MTDDGDDEWVNEEIDDGPKVILDHAVMSSPIISLVLDHKDSTGHNEKVTFHVHKLLLASSGFLSACLGPDTTEIILDSKLKPYAVSAVVQYIYSADFTLEDSFQTIEDEEGYFQKLTNVEWTCCYLDVPAARELALCRLEKSYEGFEFRINTEGMAMRIKMTEWVYSIDECFVEADGKIQHLRQRVLGGWTRDVQHDGKLYETFENLLMDYPTFSFDLRQFLIDRVLEDGRMQRKLDAFEKAERTGMHRVERQRNLLFPNLTRHRSRPQLPTLKSLGTRTPSGQESPLATPMSEVDPNVGLPPRRKKASRVSDMSEQQIGIINSSRLRLHESLQ
ncbi:hypothetical protein ABW20_dc0105541 [Dactylellina cionopaga]|nr:hypothetical protein ABW20_dc0105541 [Dactylellina cionopaga]